MNCTREHLQYLCYALGAAAIALVCARRWARSVERRMLLIELPILFVTVIACVWAGLEFRASTDVLVALVLVELGVLARVYHAHRTYRSASGNLRNVGNLYILVGLVCILSHSADFPGLLWLIPLAFFACGYFFLRNRRGLANLCKGCGALVALGFIASMVYDVYEGGTTGRGPRPARGELPEVVRPSFVEQLNARNEKVEALEGAKKRLAEDLQRVRAEQCEIEGQVEKEAALRQDAERKVAALEKAVSAAEEAARRLKAENEQLQAALKKEIEAKTTAEGKLIEFEKIKAAAKESVTATTEKLDDAAENLKKVVAERDGLKTELDALKAAAPAPGAAEGGLAQQLKEKEEARAKLAAETARLRATLELVREAVAGEPAALEGQGD